MLLFLFFIAGLSQARSEPLEVKVLTSSGPKILRVWSVSELKELAKSGSISAQDLIFENSTRSLDLKDKADVDLITLHGANGKIARVPRFMIWRGTLKLRLEKDGTLSSRASSGLMMVPTDLFRVRGIQRIELSRASVLYPGTRLSVRTNPAASRGQKLFTQSCMACHSLGQVPPIQATLLNETYLRDFDQMHRATSGFRIDPRGIRGLLAYREALASEKTVVKSAE